MSSRPPSRQEQSEFGEPRDDDWFTQHRSRLICWPDPHLSSPWFRVHFHEINRRMVQNWGAPEFPGAVNRVSLSIVAPKLSKAAAHFTIGSDWSNDIRIPMSSPPEYDSAICSRELQSSCEQNIGTTLSSQLGPRSNKAAEVDFVAEAARNSSIIVQSGGPLYIYPNPRDESVILKNLTGNKIFVRAVADGQIHGEASQVLERNSSIYLQQDEHHYDMEFSIKFGNEAIRVLILPPQDVPYEYTPEEYVGYSGPVRTTSSSSLLSTLHLTPQPEQEAHLPAMGDVPECSLAWLQNVNLCSSGNNKAYLVRKSDDPEPLIAQTFYSASATAEDVIINASRFENQAAALQQFSGNHHLMEGVGTDPRTLTTLFNRGDCRHLAQSEWLQEKYFSNLEELDVLLVLAGVCTLLIEMHARGLVHGHIEPSNIYFSRFRRIVKVMGFLNVSHVTGILPYGGSTDCVHPFYLAPEEVGSRKRTIQGDIYALGITGYFLLNTMPLPEANGGQFHRQGLVLPDSVHPIQSSAAEELDAMWKWLEQVQDGTQFNPVKAGTLRDLFAAMTSLKVNERPSAMQVWKFAMRELENRFPDWNKELKYGHRGFKERCDPWRMPNELLNEWITEHGENRTNEFRTPQASDFGWVDGFMEQFQQGRAQELEHR